MFKDLVAPIIGYVRWAAQLSGERTIVSITSGPRVHVRLCLPAVFQSILPLDFMLARHTMHRHLQQLVALWLGAEFVFCIREDAESSGPSRHTCIVLTSN